MPYPRVTALDTSSTVLWPPRSEALGISPGTRGTLESDLRLFELSRGEADIAVRTAQPNHPGWSPDPWHSGHQFLSGGRTDLVGSPSVDCAGECGRSSDQPSDKRRCARVHVHAGGYKPPPARGECTVAARAPDREGARAVQAELGVVGGLVAAARAVHSSLSRTTLHPRALNAVLESQCAKQCAN